MLSKLEALFRKIPVKYRFAVWVVMAFAAVLSFFHINSYFADKHHLNWLFWTLGIVFAIPTVAIFKIANDENKADKDK